MEENYWDILIKCAETGKERGETYGDIKENFYNIVSILKANYGLELEPYQVAEVLIAVKIARNLNMEKEDNVIDEINYIAIRKDLYNNK